MKQIKSMKHNETLTVNIIPPGSKFKKPLTITKRGDRLWLKFPYNKKLLDEIKIGFTSPKWHGFETPPIKQWSVKDNHRAWWLIDYLQGKNPYARYKENGEAALEFERPLYNHQKEMVVHLLCNKHCLIAFEMGSGKTLGIIEALERADIHKCLYVAPRSALHAVELEFLKWGALIQPQYVTYNSLKKIVETWEPGRAVYEAIIFDECHKLKTPTSQRSEAALHLAEALRTEYGYNGYLWLMSGSPAPKSPMDWWHQCEVACPGYLREGSIHRFKERISIIANAENQITGGVYQQIVTWKDDEKKCDICGQTADHPDHDIVNSLEETFHSFKPSRNEVDYLYKRMKGLVLVRLKKDCLDLPDKQYQIIQCEPTSEILRAANLIVETSTSTIQALTLLRELSDGFQYQKEVTDTRVCPVCHGNKEYTTWMYVGDEDSYDNEPDSYEDDPNWEKRIQPCPSCGAIGTIDVIDRKAIYVDCPKDKALKELIDQHDEVGRMVIYAGFTASVDRCVNLIRSIHGWEYIRVDGRGWDSSIGGNPTGLLQAFQDYKVKFPRLVFIGQPGAAGQGLTLTASPSIIYFSNDFNGESRIQSEDRIHRPGMDLNLGATIYDLVHLPTDQYILDNLKKKRELQSISLGELQRCIQI